MARPRSGKFIRPNVDHGIIYLSRDLYDEIMEIAEMEYIHPQNTYLGWEYDKKNLVTLWISNKKNQHTSKLINSGVRNTIYFKSRKLANTIKRNDRIPCKIFY